MSIGDTTYFDVRDQILEDFRGGVGIVLRWVRGERRGRKIRGFFNLKTKRAPARGLPEWSENSPAGLAGAFLCKHSIASISLQ